MTKSWIIKYIPKKKQDIVGQDKAISQIIDFINNFKKQKKKALLLFGPSGIGKTIGVYAVADAFNYEVFEINASDFRNKKEIEAKLAPALKQQSLFSKGKIILVDEIDGLSGTKDRGGIQAVTKLIADAKFPIIMTAFNPYVNKFSSVRSKSTLIQFNPLDYKDVFQILKNICDKENIKFDETALKGLARRTGGDARAAINDLQTLAQHKLAFTKEDLEELESRNQIESMPQALVKIFKNSDAKIALSAFDNINEDIDQRFLWIDENLPKEYKLPNDLAQAYTHLSRADVMKGRIRRWQHWRYLAYIHELISAGIATSKTEKNKDFVKYTPTGRILKLWHAKMKYAKRKEISKKIADSTHTSSKRSLHDSLHYIKEMFKNKELAAKLTKELDFSPDEVEWLKK